MQLVRDNCKQTMFAGNHYLQGWVTIEGLIYDLGSGWFDSNEGWISFGISYSGDKSSLAT